MPDVPRLRQKFSAGSCRKAHRKKTETEQRLARAFAAGCDKHRDVERVRPARQCLAPSDARRQGIASNDRSQSTQDPRSRRHAPSRKYPRGLPSKKDLPKRMIHTNCSHVRLTAIQRHTASMFLSPLVLRCGRFTSGEEGTL